MRLSSLYRESVQKLREAGVENAETDVFLLIEHCFQLTRSQLILEGEKDVSPEKQVFFEALLERRLVREPLQHITGMQEFWSLDFLVTPDVLIPRPETEFLLDHVIKSVARFSKRPQKVVDMCTGSGVIGIVLARELSPAMVVAVDKSLAALDVAKRNQERLCPGDRIRFVCSDLFSGLSAAFAYDLIVANPPYISERDLSGLEPEVKDWEPRLALTSGIAGLDCIEELARQALSFLNPDGAIFLEIGADQSSEVTRIFSTTQLNSRQYRDVRILSDWAGRPRVLEAYLAIVS